MMDLKQRKQARGQISLKGVGGKVLVQDQSVS